MQWLFWETYESTIIYRVFKCTKHYDVLCYNMQVDIKLQWWRHKWYIVQKTRQKLNTVSSSACLQDCKHKYLLVKQGNKSNTKLCGKSKLVCFSEKMQLTTWICCSRSRYDAAHWLPDSDTWFSNEASVTPTTEL